MATRDRRQDHLRQRVDHWSGRLRIAPRIVRVQRMTRKWGSCSTKGIVTLAEDLADQKRAFQDFVIVHELLHLRLPNHSKVFKALMSLHVPHWRKQNVLRQRRLSDLTRDVRNGWLRSHNDDSRTKKSMEPLLASLALLL